VRLKPEIETGLQIILGAAAVLLLGAMAVDVAGMRSPAQGSLPAVRLPEPSVLPIPRVDRTRPIDAYAAVVDRPLFYPDRKPRSPAASIASAPVSKMPSNGAGAAPGEMILTAVVIQAGHPLAILESGRGKVVSKVGIGETVEGWKLAQVQPESVTLTKGNEVKVLELRIQGSPSPGRKPSSSRAATPKQKNEEQTQETPALDNKEAPPAPQSNQGNSG
jgi:hypothetical protein